MFCTILQSIKYITFLENKSNKIEYHMLKPMKIYPTRNEILVKRKDMVSAKNVFYCQNTSDQITLKDTLPAMRFHVYNY